MSESWDGALSIFGRLVVIVAVTIVFGLCSFRCAGFSLLLQADTESD